MRRNEIRFFQPTHNSTGFLRCSQNFSHFRVFQQCFEKLKKQSWLKRKLKKRITITGAYHVLFLDHLKTLITEKTRKKYFT